jgi:hypothetical protein
VYVYVRSVRACSLCRKQCNRLRILADIPAHACRRAGVVSVGMRLPLGSDFGLEIGNRMQLRHGTGRFWGQPKLKTLCGVFDTCIFSVLLLNLITRTRAHNTRTQDNPRTTASAATKRARLSVSDPPKFAAPGKNLSVMEKVLLHLFRY